MRNDLNYRSDDPDNELDDLNATIEAALGLSLGEGLSFDAGLTLEEVGEPGPGEDRAFAEHGIFVEELNLNYEWSRFRLFAGKFGANFSIAYDAAPGIYGTEVGEEEIELAERIGFGGGFSFGGDELGEHELSASVFFLDTSALSESASTNRGRVRRSDGGPSNTESLESLAVALDGSALPRLPGLQYHIGFASQAVDSVIDEDGMPVADTAAEYRFALAALWPFEAARSLTVTPLFEWVRFWNAGGVEGERRDYLTGSALFEFDNWNLALVGTGRLVSGGETDVDDFGFQVSAGYAFENGIGLDVGWWTFEEEGVRSQVFGVSLSYSLEF